MNTKLCSKCKEEKAIDNFYKEKTGRIASRCKKCSNIESSQWCKNHPEFEKERHYKYDIKYPKKYLLRSAKKRAKRDNLEFTLTEDDFEIPSICPILDIPIQIKASHRDFSVTIDRLDSSKGYTKDNIILVSFKANRIKCDSTEEERRLIFMFYKRKMMELYNEDMQ